MRRPTFQSERFLVSGGCREGHTGDFFGDQHRARTLCVAEADVVAEPVKSSTGSQVTGNLSGMLWLSVLQDGTACRKGRPTRRNRS